MNKEHIDFINMVRERLSAYPCFSTEVRTFIACQFAVESCFGKSSLAVNQSNYCGMRYPVVRITLAVSESPQNGFAMFNSLDDCIADYMLCLNYHQPFRKDLEQLDWFMSFIKFYCPERDYVSKIFQVFTNYQNFKPYAIEK